jgi:hypothetical protein
MDNETARKLRRIMRENRWPISGLGVEPVDLYDSAVHMCSALVHGTFEHVGLAKTADEVEVAVRCARRDYLTVVAVQDLLAGVQR